jgi:hypothetical protein
MSDCYVRIGKRMLLIQNVFVFIARFRHGPILHPTIPTSNNQTPIVYQRGMPLYEVDSNGVQAELSLGHYHHIQ